MSELKALTMMVDDFGFIRAYRKQNDVYFETFAEDFEQFYLKSEADAELNRQKYLRCESLIKTCLAKSQTWSCRYYYAETDSRRKICFDFMIHYNKRAEVLRKLAEKFKEVK